jgi:MoxR-like ATPase
METPRKELNQANAPRALTSEDAAIVARLCEARERIREEIAKVIVGQEPVIDHMLVGLLCRGHILLLGVPGLGKTLMARTLARTLDLEFRRIQFTPDLMPSDITGMDIIEEDPATGRRKLEFLPGRAIAGHAGTRGLDRAAHLFAQSAFLCGRHSKSDRDGRYLSAA